MGGREEARMLHMHEASVEEGRVEGGRGGREQSDGGRANKGREGEKEGGRE